MAYASSESDFYVKIEKIEGLWATRTGGNAPLDTSQTYNGGDDTAIVVVGKSKPTQMTLSRPFDPRRDQELANQLEKRKGSPTFRPTISQQPTLSDGTIIGTATTWTECVLIDVNVPDTNAGSSSPAVLELVFLPGRKL